MVNPTDSAITPNYDKMLPPTDSFKSRKFTNIGGKMREAFGGGVVNNIKKMGQAFMKFKDAPPQKTTKSETCFWGAVLCAIVAVVLIAALGAALGPGALAFAIPLAMIPGVGGAVLFNIGLRERKKEKKLEEWEMPKLKITPDPNLTPEQNEAREKEFHKNGFDLWQARNTAKSNMEMNQREITELKMELTNAKRANQPIDHIQEKIDQRNSAKAELFKDFEDKSVKFWSHTNPEKGATLKERFNEARKQRGEENLFQIENLIRSEEEGDLPSS